MLCTVCKDVTKPHCFDCYMSEVAVSSPNINEQPTLRHMRSMLLTRRIETTNEDNVLDVADLFEALVENNENEIYEGADLMAHISLPLHKTSYLNNEKVICRFDLRNGASFIRDNSLTLYKKLDIVYLLPRLVHASHIKNGTEIEKIISILPDMIVDFAQRSRFHSGYRLLKRAVRHAMDPEGCSIMSSNCYIVECQDTIGIHISHIVKASMKKEAYRTNVSFTTSTDILAVSCTCKSGSINDEKIICVHVLPVLLQLAILLFDGLSEHLLCELANDLDPDIETILNNEQTIKLKDSLGLLRRANSDIDIVNNNLTINILLSKYNVGTQSYKKGPGPPTIEAKLGPLRDFKLENPFMKAKRAFEIKNKEGVVVSDH